MIKVFCDRCENEISSNHDARIVSVSDANVKFEKDDFSELLGIYCRGCVDLVWEVLNADAVHDGHNPDG